MHIAAVVIFFKPMIDAVESIRALACEEIRFVVVINDASAEVCAMVAGIPYVNVLTNQTNIGLAAALNQGIEEALANPVIDAVLLLDQDSKPSVAMIDTLYQALTAIRATGVEPSCIGPRLIDIKAPKTNVGGNSHNGSRAPFTVVESLATSGTLIPRVALESVGLMMEQLFIDCIDHEWCLRASSMGRKAFLVNNAVMMHDMGEGAINYFGRFKPIHRSPIRHYYIIRNNLIMLRLPYIPFGWKLKEFLKTIRRFIAYIFISNDRSKTMRMMLNAVVDGFSEKIRSPMPAQEQR